MHSWWIDLFIQHIAGVMIQDGGDLIMDSLPMGLDFYDLKNLPFHGQSLEVVWRKPGTSPDHGLIVKRNGKAILKNAEFLPGSSPLRIDASSL
jgi:hypothetical protein